MAFKFEYCWWIMIIIQRMVRRIHCAFFYTPQERGRLSALFLPLRRCEDESMRLSSHSAGARTNQCAFSPTPQVRGRIVRRRPPLPACENESLHAAPLFFYVTSNYWASPPTSREQKLKFDPIIQELACRWHYQLENSLVYPFHYSYEFFLAFYLKKFNSKIGNSPQVSFPLNPDEFFSFFYLKNFNSKFSNSPQVFFPLNPEEVYFVFLFQKL